MIVLEQFVCDYCGEIIKTPDDGIVEYLYERDKDGNLHNRDFRIIHQAGKSPFQGIDRGTCTHHIKGQMKDIDLSYLLSDPEGILNRLFSNDLKSNDFLIFRNRLTVPYYEEARIYFHKAQKEKILSNDDILFPDSLLMQMIAEKYRT